MAKDKKTKRVWIKTSQEVPDAHLDVAKVLFENQGFTYWGGAEGYSVKDNPEDPCGVIIGDKTDENKDKIFDVECLRGLVKTSAKAMKADWDGHWYEVNDLTAPGYSEPPYYGCRYFLS